MALAVVTLAFETWRKMLLACIQIYIVHIEMSSAQCCRIVLAKKASRFGRKCGGENRHFSEEARRAVYFFHMYKNIFTIIFHKQISVQKKKIKKNGFSI